jgi:5'-deoxynucleotidase YfbR-like HD superfamily hydrolase
MALVYDLAESVIGDIPTFAQVPLGEHPHVILSSEKLTHVRTKIYDGRQEVLISRKFATTLQPERSGVYKRAVAGV